MNKHFKPGIQLGIVALAVSGLACSQDKAAPLAEEPPAAAEPSAQAEVVEPGNHMLSLNFGQQISTAVADLSDRTGVATDEIKVIHARAVTWNSGAVGCPEEGMMYTQAIVPGMQLLLEADGTVYHYHGRSRSGGLFYCPAERAKAPAYGPGQDVM